jgi:hypothetical protein
MLPDAAAEERLLVDSKRRRLLILVGLALLSDLLPPPSRVSNSSTLSHCRWRARAQHLSPIAKSPTFTMVSRRRLLEAGVSTKLGELTFSFPASLQMMLARMRITWVSTSFPPSACPDADSFALTPCSASDETPPSDDDPQPRRQLWPR